MFEEPDAKPIYCANCSQEIVGDAWYKGQYITYTHKARGNFLCFPENWAINNHAELVNRNVMVR